jgi:hypothetical protein
VRGIKRENKGNSAELRVSAGGREWAGIGEASPLPGAQTLSPHDGPVQDVAEGIYSSLFSGEFSGKVGKSRAKVMKNQGEFGKTFGKIRGNKGFCGPEGMGRHRGSKPSPRCSKPSPS